MKKVIYIFMFFCFIANIVGCKEETVEVPEKDPIVKITEAYNADNSTVQVSGIVINAGKEVNIVYEYGTVDTLLNKKSYTVTEVRNDTTFVTASIGGLTKSTKYFIKLAAFKKYGYFKSDTISFNTTANATPTIGVVVKKSVTVDGFQIEAEINPANAATTYKVHYGIEPNVLSAQSTPSAVLTGTASQKSIVSVTGLPASKTIYYQIVATNPSGVRKSKVYSLQTNEGTVTDIDGNVYKTTKIGDQVWTTSNWASSKYADGSTIDSCFIYGNVAANLPLYGRLYTYEALKLKNIAPAGWRVPTKADWEKLIATLGGESNSGSLLKDVSFMAPSSTVPFIDKYNFGSIPSGMRNAVGKYFHTKDVSNVSWYAYYWGMTEVSATEAYRVHITYVYNGCYAGKAPIKNAYSLRLIKE